MVPQFSGIVDINGSPVFDDIDGNGSIITAPSLFDSEGDFAALGTGIPNLEMAAHTRVNHNGFEFSVQLRGAFGHVLSNRTRQFHELEVAQGSPQLTNLVRTPLAIEGLQQSRFSSLYVENADFVKLDYISIGKSFNFSTGSKKSKTDDRIDGPESVDDIAIFRN